MELIIAVLFFALAGTVCIQLFAKSHLLSQETVNQNQAVTWAQNLAEAYIGTECRTEELLQLFPDGEVRASEPVFCLYWDRSWQPLSASRSGEAAYAAILADQGFSSDTGLHSADISVNRLSDSSVIYSLHIDHHIPERRP